MKIDVESKLLSSLLVLGSMVEARDAYTGGHLWRVANYAKLLGHRVGMRGKELFRLTLGAYLHDIGKIGIPDSILLKKGALTENEFAIMKSHPVIGHELMEQHPLGGVVIDVVTHHHERIDGAGYPHEHSYEDVSQFARIVTLVDAFDAVTSARPYRRRMSLEEGLAVVEEGRGTQFDSQLVSYFVEMRSTEVLRQIVGSSREGRPMLDCKDCGPVIVLPKRARDGDKLPCKSCGGEHRIHREGEAFATEKTGQVASPESMKPEPDMETIDEIVSGAPRSVRV